MPARARTRRCPPRRSGCRALAVAESIAEPRAEALPFFRKPGAPEEDERFAPRRLSRFSLEPVERRALRPGTVHSADDWRPMLEHVVARYRRTLKRLYFRGDAAFANPEIYQFLEAEGMGYAIPPPANRVLQDRIFTIVRSRTSVSPLHA